MSTSASTSRRVVLTLCDYFLPGVNGGGPIASIVNTATRLAADYDFRVVSRDRDAGHSTPYPDILTTAWMRAADIPVHYIAPGMTGLARLASVLRTTPFDILYVNSLFSPFFSIYPLMLRRLRWIPMRPLVLAPRGELSAGALEIKKSKKQAFLSAVKAGNLLKDAIWQACSALEEEDIRRVFGREARIVVAPNLPSSYGGEPIAAARHTKSPGTLRLVFLSRICVKKNLAYALDALKDIRGKVEFSIVGPQEDAAYWSQCRALIESLPANITVSIRGPVKPHEVPGVMRQHDVFVLPTYGENYGHVIVEALTSGCPVLISDQTPWRDLRRQQVGWDVALQNREGFVAALQEAADWGEAELSTFRRSARIYARGITENAEVLESNRSLFRRAA